MNKRVMEVPFMGYWITVDRIGGYGAERCDISLRERNEKGRPGKRANGYFGARRAELIRMAFDLLDVADFMQPDTTYAMSDTVHASKGESLPVHAGFNKLRKEVGTVLNDEEVEKRKLSTTLRFEQIRRRMSTLQLAQIVLEECNTDIAESINAILTFAKKSGDLPFRAEFGITVLPEKPGVSLGIFEIQEEDDSQIKH
ncbi:MAG: hypothetical protein LBE75_05315 [Burkholderiales bacterium]|nr:hypothetical protein [Burkholderiales bacterium]